MWKLEKPLLEDAIRDIENIIEESNGDIPPNEEPMLSFIYRLYDRNNGQINASDNDRCSSDIQSKLYKMYDSKTYEGQKLYYMRQELFKSVDFCPMCGIGEPSQLDHQMPRKDFKTLSLCRLNLVPLCGICNNKKRDKNSLMFIHPYYEEFPDGVIFLVANIHINEQRHVLSWNYEFDIKGLDKTLGEKIQYQSSVIKLFRRLQKESNSFISELFCFRGFLTDEALKEFLRNEYNKILYLYGHNDWRTALLHALFVSPKFGKEEAAYLAGKCKPYNCGVNI